MLGVRADIGLTVVALAATANTVLLLLVSASRSVYGMAAAGVLPRRLARVSGSAIPVTAATVVLALLGVLVSIGTLSQLAVITDAAVLVAFMFVNLSLPWLALRRGTPARGYTRVAEVVLPALGLVLCAWLLLHSGGVSVMATVGLAGVGVLFAPGSRITFTRLLRRARHRS